MKPVYQFLKKSISQERLAHSYLIIGAERGSDFDKISGLVLDAHKNSLGYALVAERIFIRANEKGVIGREEIKELFSFAKLRPVFSRRKLIIIEDAHLLTLAAVNNLLKIVEEPPSFLIFFLLTQRPERLPQTIVSRCVVIKKKKEPRQKAISQDIELPLYDQLKKSDLNQRFIFAEKLAKKDKKEIIDFLNKWLIGLGKNLPLLPSEDKIKEKIALINQVKYTKGVLENTYASPRLCLERLFLKMDS